MHQAEQRPPQADKPHSQQRAQHKVQRGGKRVDAVHAFHILCAAVLADEDHGRQRDDVEQQNAHCDNLVRIAHGGHSRFIEMAELHLVHIAHQKLKNKLDENRPAQPEQRPAGGVDARAFHSGPPFTRF